MLVGGLAPRYIVGSDPLPASPHVGTTDVDLVITLANGDSSETYASLYRNLTRSDFAVYERTGKSPVDRRKLGWKWSVAGDAAGTPVGWAATGANRNGNTLFGPIMDRIAERELPHDIDTVHLDRGFRGTRVDRCAATPTAGPSIESPSSPSPSHSSSPSNPSTTTTAGNPTDSPIGAAS